MDIMADGIISALAARAAKGFKRLNQKEENMQLYLWNYLDKNKMTSLTLFRIAHVFFFASDPPMEDLVAQYELHGIIPTHVIRYLRHLQENES